MARPSTPNNNQASGAKSTPVGANSPTSIQAPESTLRRQAQPNLLIRVQDMLFLFLRNWKWFAVSLIVIMGAAYIHLKKTPSIYTRAVSLLIKDDKKGTNGEDPLLELGLKGAGYSNITNELLSMKSYELAEEITRNLALNVNYSRHGSFHDEVAYGVNLPIQVRFLDLPENEGASLNVSLSPDSMVTISNLRYGAEAYTFTYTMHLGDVVRTPLGNLTVVPSPYFQSGVADDLIVNRRPMRAAAGTVQAKLTPVQRDRNSTIIDVYYSDESIARAEDILNTFVTVYNANWIQDRNRITVSTSDFIKERLQVIERELGEVDSDIAEFKSSNLVLDIEAAGARATAKAEQAEETDEDLRNQLYMTKYVKSYLTDGLHENQLLPSISGIDNGSIMAQISAYNSTLLQRNNHLSNSSAQNPLVLDLEENLATMRAQIILSLDNEVSMLERQIESVQNAHGNAINRIANTPGQAKYLLSVERQQKVKESLYLFLLQKREENELSQAFTAYNTRLIEGPHGSGAPTYPNSKSIYTYAFLFAIALPAGFFLLKENLNTAVRGRKDLDDLQVPFAGEIPQQAGTKLREQKKARDKRARDKRKGRHRHHDRPVPQMVVIDKNRNVMNEAFRVVRNNVEMMIGYDVPHSVIMVTSMNPSSGKTFITANLANALGIAGKKVLALDLDLRKASLSEYVGKPHHGISDYLSGKSNDVHELIRQVASIDLLPCGTIPPNPAEMFLSERFKELMAMLREEYDYIIIDCPPVEIVADAAIIGRVADRTLFVVRAGLMDRAFLPDVQTWYDTHRYPDISIILNGTSDAFSHYGYHRYGYRYGYHYGNYGGYGNYVND